VTTAVLHLIRGLETRQKEKGDGEKTPQIVFFCIISKEATNPKRQIAITQEGTDDNFNHVFNDFFF
jgi:hypothetical protein